MALTITSNRGAIVLNRSNTGDTPLTIDRGVTVSAGSAKYALYANYYQQWIITNFGTLTGGSYTVSLNGDNEFGQGSVLTNSGTASHITGNGDGIHVLSANGTIINQGTISGGTGYGVGLAGGNDTVINSGPAAHILGHTNGIYAEGTAAVVSNQGTISGASDDGVYLKAGGLVTNSATGARITGQTDGIYAKNFTVTVSNQGTISGTTGDGVYLDAGGRVTSSGTAALISGGGNYGVRVNNGAGFVTNAGSIISSVAGVDFLNGGTLTNSGTAALVRGGTWGAYFGEAGGLVTVFNQGTIAGTAASSEGIKFGDGGTLTNSGTAALISGAAFGVYGANQPDTITNQGSITGGTEGIRLYAGGTVTNTGSINGGYAGVIIYGTAENLDNQGTVTGGTAGVWLKAGGSIANGSNDVISSAYAIIASNSAASVLNSGQILGITKGVELAAGGSVTNTQGATITGEGAYAVQIAGGAGTVVDTGTIEGGPETAVSLPTGFADQLMLYPGAQFTGIVDGGNTIGALSTSALLLMSSAGAGTLGGVGTTIVDFGSISVAASAVWTLTSDAVAAGVLVYDSGTLTNCGTIGSEVTLAPGATLTNASGGTVEVAGAIAVTSSGTATIVNAGSVYGRTYAVELAGGSVTNLGTTAVISGGAGGGVYARSATASITNQGTISGAGASVGVNLKAGGSVTNSSTAALISGGAEGAYARGPAIVSNQGTISGGVDFGVFLYAGGSLANSGTAALISGGDRGIFADAAATVSNLGTIIGSAQYGVELTAGGTVTNAGTIRGGTDAVTFKAGFNNRLVVDPGAVFLGTVDGGGGTLELAGTAVGTLNDLGAQFINFVYTTIDSGAQWSITGSVASGATLSNAGTIESELALAPGATLTNTSTIGVAGVGVAVTSSGAATVVNAGSIYGHTYGVALGGGSVTNLGTAAVISGGLNGVVAKSTAATVTNLGTIIGSSSTGVDLGAGGVVTNSGTAALISGGGNGISAAMAATISNQGTISGTSKSGLVLAGGGAVTNSASALISGSIYGVYANNGGPATVINAGSIEAAGTAMLLLSTCVVTNQIGGVIHSSGRVGVVIHDGGSVVNAGSVYGSDNAMYFYGTGSVTNLSRGTISAALENGIILVNAGEAVINAGQIVVGRYAAAIELGHEDSVINQSGGTIAGYYGVLANPGANVTNQAGGLITGSLDGVHIEGAAGTVTNAGTIDGGTDAVLFDAGFAHRLVVDPGATFGGTVVGGGVNSTIELAAGTGAGTLNALGTTFTNFGTVIVDAGATWTVDTATSLLPSTTFIGNGALSTLALSSAGTFSLATVSNFGTIDLASGNNVVTVTDKTLSGGAVTIVAGASGNNVISAAGDTAASKGKSLTYVTGTGTDSFTGGFENDTVAVSAAAVGGDTLTGGSGTNTLVMTSAGTLSLGGVSKFPTIDLAAGNSTVTVTDALLSGSPVTINDGASGNNTISATTDTAASKGKTLTYNAGSGTDSFTGGFENDKVNVSAAAVGGDTLTGGSGTSTLALTSAGSANLGGVSKFPTIDLASGNNVVTVTDTTLSGGSVTIIDGASGNNSVSAAGDTSASKGKTLTYNAGTGTDSFTGGFENDTVSVSAAAAGGDTLTGGSGSNTLLLTSAGTVNLGGVSKFATIDLAAGNSTVTVTDTTLSGGSVTLHDGASGNDTVSAATDTAASKGKTLSYHTGTGTDHFTGGFENDSVDVSAAAVGGDVLTGGSGSNTLVLTSAGTVSLGTVSRFATIDLATGNSTVTITDTTLNGSPAVGVHDAASGNNSVSAAGDTAASKGKTLTYYTGTGTDSFTGGFENDTVNVSAAAVGGDTLTGGSGSNLLVLTSAGTYSLGGASKFATIDLGAGNNTVTLTDAVFSIGAVGLHDPASGNQTVSAATDTAASKGKNLTYYVGAGTDNFTGGFENDTIRITAAAISGDVLTGGSGTNTVVLTSAGTVNLGGISKFGATDLASGNNTVTLTDTTFSGGGMTLKEGATGNDTVSAATDTTASKGKTLNYLAGPGTDSFTGGFENDTVSVLAAAVGGDTLTGGSGTNTLVLTSGGSANLGGVSKFAAIDLAAASSTVTVTDTTLSGGTVSLHDGAAGNDTVSAATDTAASKGKSFSYFAGTGKDSFTGGFENDTVSVSAAAVGGDVLTGGSGTNTLVLAGAGTVNLGGVSKFATIDLAAGNSTVTLTDTTLNIGAVALHDASGNETVSAAGDTAASTGKSLTYYVGSGTDSFTGGFENDTIRAAAAAAGGDVLTGGSGTNALVLTSAGAVNLGGVSRFPTVFLAAGNNAVTVTDTTLSGGTLTIKPGSSGNETISAAGDTAASSGKSLIYMAGAGADNFTGGFENDTIYAGTGLGTYTAGSGTDSFVFIADNLASQTLGNFQVASDNVLVYGIHASNGFDLGSTDNALNPTTPTAITASIFIASTSGDFTSSSQRFAYDTTNGALHYSATGSNGSESLVATLTGAPAFTAGDLVFEH